MKEIDELIEIMARLRDPVNGCPWDKEQNFSTIAPYTLEEAYEVQDSIQREDYDELKNELGDLLFQVVYHAQMASELKLFQFRDVVEQVCKKMQRRHPHVFANETINTAEEQSLSWQRIKEEEKNNGENTENRSILADILVSQPALMRAQKLQAKAATVGFDWQDILPVLEKIKEELAELTEEINNNNRPSALTDEMGDIIFACVNLARHIGVDAEYALGMTNQKFIRRFHFIEDKLKNAGNKITDMSLDELDAIWEEAKAAEDD